MLLGDDAGGHMSYEGDDARRGFRGGYLTIGFRMISPLQLEKQAELELYLLGFSCSRNTFHCSNHDTVLKTEPC